jgi:hypothetical protein
VLESEKRQKEKKLAVYSQLLFSLGAPDSVRCARLALVKRLLSGIRRRRTAKNHRTIRWCTGLSSEPTVGQANGRSRNPRVSHPALKNKARCISYMRQEDNTYNNRVYRDKCHNNQSIYYIAEDLQK